MKVNCLKSQVLEAEHACVCLLYNDANSCLQHLQCQIRWHSLISTSAHSVHTTISVARNNHGWRERHGTLEQFLLGGRLSKEFHGAGLEVVDATLDLNLATSHTLSNGLTELQQEVHGVEDVDLQCLVLAGQIPNKKACRRD